MNILIVKTSAIGDVTHTLPALHCLRRHYPRARITWLVEEAAAELLAGHRGLDRVLVSRRKRWSAALGCGAGAARQAAAEALAFVGALRDTRYDLLLDFQGLLKSGVLVALARAERKVGFGRGMAHAEGSWLFLNERIPAVDMDIHALDRELHLLRAIGVATPEVVFDLPISESHRQKVAKLLERGGLDHRRPLVAINPQATWPTKLWFEDRFAELADRLQERGCAVVFTGSPADRPVIARISGGMKRAPLNLAGETSLLELAALYQASRVVVSTDTGPMHIAAAAGARVVAIFGATAPWRTGPWGDQHLVLRTELDCGPCLKKSCERDLACMRGISVEMVERAVAEKLRMQNEE
jgi:3-deoxy-D-manno-octulosonic-acid transferase/heptosyltransferase-1